MKHFYVTVLIFCLIMIHAPLNCGLNNPNEVRISYKTLEKRRLVGKPKEELIVIEKKVEEKIIQEKNNLNSCICSKYREMFDMWVLTMLSGGMCYASPVLGTIFCCLTLNVTIDKWLIKSRDENKKRNKLRLFEEQQCVVNDLLKKIN